MVEHQTENLGVRGSNPFVGIASKLFYRYTSYEYYKHYVYTL